MKRNLLERIPRFDVCSVSQSQPVQSENFYCLPPYRAKKDLENGRSSRGRKEGEGCGNGVAHVDHPHAVVVVEVELGWQLSEIVILWAEAKVVRAEVVWGRREGAAAKKDESNLGELF